MNEIIQLRNNTYSFEDGGVRFFLIEGDRQAILLDSGMDYKDAKEAAEKITDREIIMVYTHADPDHISANASFPKFYMNLKETENYRNHNGKGDPIPVYDGYTFDLGNRIIEVIEIPGHTPGSIALLDRTNRMLFAGDSVQDGNIFMFGPMRNLPLLKESLQKLADRIDEFDDVYACHGSVSVSPQLIPQLIEGCEAIEKGEAEGVPVERFGGKVVLYRFPYAGFFCDKKD